MMERNPDYEEIWECPGCGEQTTFDRPRLKVMHTNCHGTHPMRNVMLVLKEHKGEPYLPEEPHGAITIPEDAPYKPEDY